MKNRIFMLGLGLGLVIGALLLQLMQLGQRHEQLNNLDLTAEQLQQAAQKLDLQVVDASEELLTEAQWEERSATAEDGQEEQSEGSAELEQQQSKEPQLPEEPGAPSEPADKTTGKAAPAAAPKEPAPIKEPVTLIPITIKNGSNLTDVAQALKAAGIISSQEQFIKKASARKLNTKIQSGSYSFKAGEDMDVILTQITTKGEQ